ncbi:hypothetical protein D3C87_1833820 [compost metagenome]
MFAALAFLGEAVDDRFKRLQNFLFIDVFLVELIEPVPGKTRSQVHIVSARSLPDERDFAQCRSGTAIRAAGHADDDFFTPQARLVDDQLQLIQQLRKVTFCFGHGQPAGRQRHTGHCTPPQRRMMCAIR